MKTRFDRVVCSQVVKTVQTGCCYAGVCSAQGTRPTPVNQAFAGHRHLCFVDGLAASNFMSNILLGSKRALPVPWQVFQVLSTNCRIDLGPAVASDVP
jgi:hypothetical protein